MIFGHRLTLNVNLWQNSYSCSNKVCRKYDYSSLMLMSKHLIFMQFGSIIEDIVLFSSKLTKQGYIHIYL